MLRDRGGKFLTPQQTPDLRILDKKRDRPVQNQSASLLPVLLFGLCFLVQTNDVQKANLHIYLIGYRWRLTVELVLLLLVHQ
ncbi:hypothetical protein D3C72_2049840 [compost metagenome]